MRRDVLLVLFVAVAALGIRTYPAWNAVFSPTGIRFLETDAWYHVRLTENQVRNFPWRVTNDPFAAPEGQFVPIAPLFDTITSTLVVTLHGRDASTRDVERIAALTPPVFGALTVVALWAVACVLFDRRAALIGAALLAILPGHFMDRTMLGFVDHHALESLLAMCVLLTFARGLTRPSRLEPVFAGLALGLYLLAWGSGAFLVAIIGLWLLVHALLATSTASIARPAGLTATAAVVALAVVVAFQDSSMHRYGTQILGLTGLAAMALAIGLVTSMAGARTNVLAMKINVLGGVAIAAVVISATVALFARDLIAQVIVDVQRLAPNPSRMGVLEARPLFLYSGNWDWAQPWTFFRTGIFIGAVALVPFAVRVVRHRTPADLLVFLFALATFAATIGQNRFGYYLVTACALLGGWLAVPLLDWAGVPYAGNANPIPRTTMPLAREVAVVAVAGLMFAPNLAPRVLLAERTASYPDYWRDAMQWLRDNTPPPFRAAASGADDYYFARYPRTGGPRADYSVMSWWDQGYWITQQARRVPVANPTQERAAVAGRFYSATNEADARAIASAERIRYVVSDYELPFRRIADGSIMGRFQTIVDWTGAAHDPFYEIVYRRMDGQWQPVWIFKEPYYRSMAFRLSVLGAGAALPTEAITVITLVSRVDNNGLRFRELVTEATFASFDDARRTTNASPSDAIIVGLDPWQSPFPLEPLQSFVEVHTSRTAEQGATETPWVRIFEVR